MSDRKAPAIHGGVPVRDIQARPWPKWPVFDESDEAAIIEALRSGIWWGGEGPNGSLFATEFASFQNAAYGVCCTNGTAALEIALQAAGIGCGDEVILPAYTFMATASSILTVGATPVFVDIEPHTLNLDAACIEGSVTARTRAVVPVHVGGRPADLDAVSAVTRRHGLMLIEDAAQAVGASWRGRGVASIGDMGTFSFQASKNLNAGEGGMVLTNDENLADLAWSITNVGRPRPGKQYEHTAIGTNLRMTEFQAALLRSQLKRVPEQTATRTANAAYLNSLLAPIEGIRLMAEDERITSHANHLFTFRYSRDAFGGVPYADFISALNREGIPCSRGYTPLYREQLFERIAGRKRTWCELGKGQNYLKMRLPVCEEVCADTVWIHQRHLLGDQADMEDIAEGILKLQKAFA